MQKISTLMWSWLAVMVLAVPLWAAAPALETYELTRMDMRGDLVRDIEVHPTNTAIVYTVGQNGGVYKSTDSGQTWNHLIKIDARGLGIDHRNPDTVYAGGFGGIQKTTDGGKTWNHMVQATLRSVGVHPASGVIFGGGNSGAIWRSDDGGQTWTRPVSATNGEINKWAFHPTDPNIVYHSAAKNRGVYKSTDGGNTFREVLSEYGRAVAISRSNPNILYSSQQKSVDGGETWTPTGGAQAWAVAIHPKNPDIVYKASQGDAVFMTTNGGRHWTQMKGLTRGGLTDLTAHWSIAIDGEKDILYVGAAVMYKADNASSREATLYESSKGIVSPGVVSIAGTKNVLWIGTDGQGVVRSTDYGRSWERKLLGLRSKLNLGALNIHPLDNNIIYSAGEGGLVKTNNGGQIWLHMPRPPGSVSSVTIDPQDKNGVYTITEQKLYYSGDGGFNWQEWDKTQGKVVTSFAIHPFQPRTMFIRTDQGWQRSDNAGQSWQNVEMPGAGSLIFSQNTATPNTYYFVLGNTLSKSTDGGKSWAGIREIGQFRGLSEAPDGTLWIVDRGEVHRSADGGTTWESRGVGHEIRRLLVDPQNPQAVFVAAKGGLFRLHPAGAVLPPAPPAPAPTPEPQPAVIQIKEPGVLDRANTTYQLTSDISVRGSAFFVIADNITIDGQGHTVEFDVSAIEANGVRNLTVKNMNIRQSGRPTSHGVAHGIDLMFSPNSTVTGLNAVMTRRAASAIGISGDNAVVTDNVVTETGPFATTISVEGKGARVQNNQLNASNSGRGIAVADADGAQIVNNQITYGGPTGVSGMTVSVSPGARVQGNTIRGSGQGMPALAVLYSDNVVITDNQIASGSTLLHLNDSSKSEVRSNKLEATGANATLRFENTSGSTVSGNEIIVVNPKSPSLVFETSSNNNISANQWTGVDPLAEGAVRKNEESKDNVIR